MNKLSHESKVLIINCLCNGMSLRATARVTGHHRTTCMRVLEQVGVHCKELHQQYVTNMVVRNIQVDEIWSFVRMKERRLTPKQKKSGDIGNQFLYYGLDTDTKLILAFHLGRRDTANTDHFIGMLRATIGDCRPQLSTDGFYPYIEAVERHFGRDCDYGIVVKEFSGRSSDFAAGRFAPARVKGVRKELVSGDPDMETISTSHVERANLTLRQFQHRYQRLGLGFSKKLEALWHACALWVTYYNFCWIPRTQSITPAMAAQITRRVWSVDDLIPMET